MSLKVCSLNMHTHMFYAVLKAYGLESSHTEEWIKHGVTGVLLLVEFP